MESTKEDGRDKVESVNKDGRVVEVVEIKDEDGKEVVENEDGRELVESEDEENENLDGKEHHNDKDEDMEQVEAAKKEETVTETKDIFGRTHDVTMVLNYITQVRRC